MKKLNKSQLAFVAQFKGVEIGTFEVCGSEKTFMPRPDAIAQLTKPTLDWFLSAMFRTGQIVDFYLCGNVLFLQTPQPNIRLKKTITPSHPKSAPSPD